MAKVAVVLLNWNGEKILPKFLPSVVENSSDAEIYIIDNNSTDNSIAYVKKNFPQIKIIQLDKNYGYAGGYQYGLKQIKADYFILLNTDVAVPKNWIKPIIDFMEANPEISAVQPKILSYSNPEYFEYAGAAGGFIDKFGYPFARGRIFDTIEKDSGQYNDIREIFWATGAALFIRAKDFFEIGGLDVDFFAHMEEIDLAWRLKNAGKKIYVYPKVAVYHLGGGSLPYQSPRKIYLNFRNNLWLLAKNLPANKLYIIALRIVLDWLSAIKFIAEIKPLFALKILQAHIQFISTIPKISKKRKQQKEKFFNFEQVYPKSIVFQYFIKKKRYFSQLNW